MFCSIAFEPLPGLGRSAKRLGLEPVVARLDIQPKNYSGAVLIARIFW
jgi:hypothetical protein